MELIENPKTLAEGIVNAICNEIYGRSGGDIFFDSITDWAVRDELKMSLVLLIERILSEQA